MKRTLKFVIEALAAAMLCSQALACPTCVGRLMLGVKKPFFELYRPRKINRRRRKKIKIASPKKKIKRRNFVEITKGEEDEKTYQHFVHSF